MGIERAQYSAEEILAAGGSRELVWMLEARRTKLKAERAAAKASAKKLDERRRELPPNVWMTAEGTEIPFEKLEDAHLIRILEHLRRRAIRDRLDAIYALGRYRPGGDGASYACDDAMAGFMREDDPDSPEFAGWPEDKNEDDDGRPQRPWERFVGPRWDALMAEATRRKITPKWSTDDDDKVRMEMEGVA